MFGLKRSSVQKKSSNWLKSDLQTSLKHAKANGTREFTIDTSGATPKNRQNVIKWIHESGFLGQILPDGRIGIRIR